MTIRPLFSIVEDRQKGSHLVLIHPSTRARTIVLIHYSGRTIKQALLRAIVRDANLTTDEFIDSV